jgi:hypothetical protein
MVAHHGTILTPDAYNEIKSKARDIFDRHFELLKDKSGYNNLRPKPDQFLDLISLFNDFTVNVIKLLYNQSDLTFLGIT